VAVHIMLDEYLGKPYEKISINIFKLLSALWKDLVNEGAITKVAIVRPSIRSFHRFVVLITKDRGKVKGLW